MENIIKIKGFHACELRGDVAKNAPFMSKALQAGDNEKEKQKSPWLTQGYYFWTDSDYFAHKWGKISVVGNYAIVECSIEIERKYLLDLVGSVADQLRFLKLLELFEERMRKIKRAKQATVSEVLQFYRNGDNFPYLAIKAQDKYFSNRHPDLPFVEGINAFLPLITRQQLCLFDSAKNCIKEKALIYPKGD